MEAATDAAAATPARLTLEEVCCLRTALAVVVLKRRRDAVRRCTDAERAAKKLRGDSVVDAEPTVMDAPASPGASLCPWLPRGAANAAAGAITPEHVDVMFRLAMGTPNVARRRALASHLQDQFIRSLEDIRMQQWLRRQVAALAGDDAAAAAQAAGVWTAVVRPEAAAEVAVRVLEELTPIVLSLLEDPAAATAPVPPNTYCLLHVLDACLTALVRAGRVDAVRDATQALAALLLPVPLSEAFLRHAGRLPLLCLRAGLRRLLRRAAACGAAAANHGDGPYGDGGHGYQSVIVRYAE